MCFLKKWVYLCSWNMIRCMKVLVVDDEQDICNVISFYLESEGYDVDTVNSA